MIDFMPPLVVFLSHTEGFLPHTEDFRLTICEVFSEVSTQSHTLIIGRRFSILYDDQMFFISTSDGNIFEYINSILRCILFYYFHSSKALSAGDIRRSSFYHTVRLCLLSVLLSATRPCTVCERQLE